MKTFPNNPIKASTWAVLALAASAALPLPTHAASVALATAPLANATTTQVLPNLLFVLDNSGSMGSDYLPDWASGADPYLFKNAGYNGVAYNPTVTYFTPVYYDTAGLNTTKFVSQTGVSTAAGAGAAAKPNWQAVKDDAYGIQANGTSNLEIAAGSYSFVPGEYCTAPDLKTCATQSAPSTTNPYPGPLRWCNSSGAATAAAQPAAGVCQAIRFGTFTNARNPMQSVATIKITAATLNPVVNGVTVNGQQIMSAPTAGGTNTTNTIASSIATAINNCTYVKTGNCTVVGYTAKASGSTVTIQAPLANTYTPALSPAVSVGTLTSTITTFAPGNNVPGSVTFTPITPSIASYSGTGRSDCAAATCTYAEEMTNYANWWTYYQTRMQAMKTSASIAFKPIDTRYRVGFTVISNTGATPSAATQSAAGAVTCPNSPFLNVNKFDLTQKISWYNTFFCAKPQNSTPLRGALSKAGRYFANRITGQTDPMQYSCQQNFTMLTTDGYWNTGDETATYKNIDLTGGLIGNMDGGSTPRPMYEGPTASAGSLADVAKYYYDTDLRTPALGNCTGALGAGVDVCENNVFISGTDNNPKQHMTTFTLGLGVDGGLQYTSDYKTAQSGDFYNLTNGYGSPTVNWPDPQVTSTSSTVEARIDDLWHAAVNGQGTYFSAKNPTQLKRGLADALAQINAKIGAGAAAATSTLNPVAGDNTAYVASYTTMKWTGNLEARSVDINTGEVSTAATWCVEDVIAASCAAPSSIVSTVTGASTTYYCRTPASTAASCAAPGVLNGTNCDVEVPVSCTGKMRAKVSDFTDTRTIYTKVGTSLGAFTYGNLTGALQTNFNSAFLATNLSQWTSYNAAQKALAPGANLVNYLRGQTGYEENRTKNIDQLFRYRDATMGDALESTPAFIGKTTFDFVDPGYSTYKAAQLTRAGTVYVGANEGMLHAFDASNGSERWAYVPTMVIPNMWKLADDNYASMHTNFVNGEPIVSDICSANCTTAAAVWKTILVAGLDGGGKGYYALDITVPTAPVLLWEFDTTIDNDLGYTFGSPVVTKLANGSWVVLFTSGYNNTTGSNPGKGFLYVVNAVSGLVINKYPTNAGDVTTPSGLAKISAWVDNLLKNNTTTYTYGGDLLGNVWRFDINAAPSSSNPLLFATLKDSSGVAQPVTTRPELGQINGKRMVFVGTGKYLELSDLTNTQQQSLYAIQDDDVTNTLNNARTGLVKQTITATGSARTGTSNAVNFSATRGWYVDFPDSGERQNIAAQLVAGVLLVATTVPSSTVCSPGGYGWFNYFDYTTGGPVKTGGNTLVSGKTNSPIVGINVVYVPDKNDPTKRDPAVSLVGADNPTPQPPPGGQPPFAAATTTSFQAKRVIWRELTQ